MCEQFLKINSALITQPGMIGRVTHETPTRATVVITDLFFPVHDTRWGKSQINANGQAWFKETQIGRSITFWKTGTRVDFEVGTAGDRFERGSVVVDWNHQPKGKR